MPLPSVSLPPVIVGPLLEGATAIRIEGTSGQLALQLDINGAVSTFLTFQAPAWLGWVAGTLDNGMFPVPALLAGSSVRARFLERGFPLSFGDWGPTMVAEAFPLSAALSTRPRLTFEVHPDQERVVVLGGPPGYPVELFQDTTSPLAVRRLGRAHVEPDGSATVALKHAIDPDPELPLYARVRNPFASISKFPVGPRAFSAPAPVIDTPYRHQRAVVVRSLVPGVEVMLTMQSPLLTFPLYHYGIADAHGVASIRLDYEVPFSEEHETTFTALSLDIVAPYASVASKGARSCEEPESGVPNDVVDDDLILPQIRGPLHVGETFIELSRWHPEIAVEVWLWALPEDGPPPRGEGGADEVLGEVVPGRSGRIALPRALTETQVAADGTIQRLWVQVVQRLGPESERGPLEIRSQGVRVEPLSYFLVDNPLPKPVILGPASDCGLAVRVGRVVPGARVVVYQDGAWAGEARAGYGSSVQVPVLYLETNTELTAIQEVGGTESELSDVRLTEGASDRLPTIVRVPATDDWGVWVAGFAPGSLVAIEDGDGYLGETVASESVVYVPLWRKVGLGQVRALARKCDQTLASAWQSPIAPILPRKTIPIREHDFDLERSVDSLDWDGDGNIDAIRGRIYLPEDIKLGAPVAVIMHGDVTGGETTYDGCTLISSNLSASYLGYGRLCRSLARAGCAVVSLQLKPDMAVEIEGRTPRPDLMEEALRLVITSANLFDSALTATHFSASKIALAGHSLGGNTALYVATRTQLPVIAVLAVAPTTYIANTVPLTISAPVMLMMGNEDSFLAEARETQDSWRWFDAAPPGSRYVWVQGVDHAAWSSVWSRRGMGSHPDRGLDDGEAERILEVLGTIFLTRHLFDRDELEPYLAAPVPNPLLGMPIQIETPLPEVFPEILIEDFEDGDLLVNTLDGENTWTGPDDQIAQLPMRWQGGAFGSTVIPEAGSGSGLVMRWRPGGDEEQFRMSFDASFWRGRRWLRMRTVAIADFVTDEYPRTGLDFLVELSDGVRTAAVRAGVLRPVPSQIERFEMSNELFPKESLWIASPITLPLQAFLGVEPLLDLTHIISVTIRLTDLWPQGTLVLDDVSVRW